MSQRLTTRCGAKKDTRSDWLLLKIKFGFSIFATAMAQFREPTRWGIVQCEAVLCLVRSREAWNVMWKEKAAASSTKHCYTCPRDPTVCMCKYRYRASRLSRSNLCVSAVFVLIHTWHSEKKEMGSGSDGKKPFWVMMILSTCSRNVHSPKRKWLGFHRKL